MDGAGTTMMYEAHSLTTRPNKSAFYKIRLQDPALIHILPIIINIFINSPNLCDLS